MKNIKSIGVLGTVLLLPACANQLAQPANTPAQTANQSDHSDDDVKVLLNIPNDPISYLKVNVSHTSKGCTESASHINFAGYNFETDHVDAINENYFFDRLSDSGHVEEDFEQYGLVTIFGEENSPLNKALVQNKAKASIANCKTAIDTPGVKVNSDGILYTAEAIFIASANECILRKTNADAAGTTVVIERIHPTAGFIDVSMSKDGGPETTFKVGKNGIPQSVHFGSASQNDIKQAAEVAPKDMSVCSDTINKAMKLKRLPDIPNQDHRTRTFGTQGANYTLSYGPNLSG